MTYQINDLVNVVKNKLKYFIIFPILFGICGLVISYFYLAPVYESRVDLLVNNTFSTTEDKLTAMDIETNLRLIETYQFIIQSDYIIDKVTMELNSKTYTNESIKRNLRIETNHDSQIISLYLRDNNLEKSVEIVNLIANTIEKEIKSLMNVENIRILTVATKDKYKTAVFPKPILFTILSTFIGFFMITIFLILSAYFNTKVSTKEDVEKFIGLPLLGSINKLKTESKKPSHPQNLRDISFILKERVSPRNHLAVEAYRTLRTNIQFQSKVKSLKTILITSTAKGEGKTITSKNLAASMAIDNKKTVLIDADLRKDNLGLGFGRIGLTNYLAGHCTLDEIIMDTSTPNLKLIASGPLPPNPAELLSSSSMDQLLKQLETSFEQIIIDSPPIFFADSAILSTKVDGCLIVIQAGKTKVTQIRQGIEQLTNVNATIVGTVLNKMKLNKNTIKNYNYGQRWNKGEKVASKGTSYY